MLVMGIDIGGANIKTVIISSERGNREVLNVLREYFPLWKLGKEGLEKKIQELSQRFHDIDKICVCMTAELCDIYSTKSEGVRHVADSIVKYFKHVNCIKFVTCNMDLVDYDYVIENPLEVAAANWAASAWLISKLFDTCIFADIGSTTTTIITIHEHRPIICGRNDPEKLRCGELVYIGTLRTPVTDIVRYLPYRGYRAEICREYFATMADVNLLLGHISEDEYYVETADHRGKSIIESATRLSRVLCASLELMNINETIEIARQIYDEAIGRIVEALILNRSRLISIIGDISNIPLVTAGIGEFMLRDAGIRAGFRTILSIDDVVKEKIRIASVLPSYAAAIMICEKST